eukprot:CAMPEP_0172302726 /NCGR_PEP_ID=MMETSP1058-20130122/4390_1 /TAXON_ID=83371 /ORGANISM="Detonula confervacea, Strain CCMP 353" /LENGTH=1412 /DNA_ID=CAMNT_0013013315 /DNA_START=162 /DNA_END=4399 /DNA_ORIENTATION=-
MAMAGAVAGAASALKQYKAEHGHVNVPYRNGKVGQFVQHQRQNYKKCSHNLTEERVNELESLGFKWSISQKERNELVAAAAAATMTTNTIQAEHNDDRTRKKSRKNDNKSNKPIETVSSAASLQFPSTLPTNKPEKEKMIRNIITSIRNKILVDSGFNIPPPKLTSTVNHALQLGYAPSYLVNKTEEDVQRLILSKRVVQKKIDVGKQEGVGSKVVGTNNAAHGDGDGEDQMILGDGEDDSSEDDEENGSAEDEESEGDASSDDEHGTLSQGQGEEQMASSSSSEDESSESDNDDGTDADSIHDKSESEKAEESELEDPTSSSDDHDDSSDGGGESDNEDDGEIASDKRGSESEGDESSEGEEDQSDEDEIMAQVCGSSDDDSDVSVDHPPLRQRGSWLLSAPPSASFASVATNGRRKSLPAVASTSSAKPRNNRFKQWMGRKKDTAVVPTTSISPTNKPSNSRFKQWMGRNKNSNAVAIQPTNVKRKVQPLNHDRWHRNFAALKLYKDTYGDTYVPSTYGSLGRFVRNTRAVYRDTPPDLLTSQTTLTEDRKQMLEEIDFHWVLHPKLRSTHTYRKRSRTILREAAAIHTVNEYGNGTTKYQDDIAVAGGCCDSNQKDDVAKQIAQDVYKMEAIKSGLAKDDDSSQVANKSVFRLGLLAGLTELDMYNAFVQLDRRSEIMDVVTSSSGLGDDGNKYYPRLSIHSSQESNSFQGWLTDRKIKWREQRQQQRKRKRDDMEDCQPNNKHLRVEHVYLDGPMLLSSRLQSEKVFESWLADRKNRWRQQQQKKKWEVNAIMEADRTSLSTHMESAKKFHHWLSVRKVIWRDQRQRSKQRKTKQTPVIENTVQIIDEQQQSDQKVVLDFSTVGVRQTSSGKWAVEISFRSKLRYMGTFKSQNHAALANEITRESFKMWKDIELDDEEIQEKVKLAREAALVAVSKLQEDVAHNDPKTHIVMPALSKTKTTEAKEARRKLKPEVKKKELVNSGEADRNPVDASEVTKTNSSLEKTKLKVPAGVKQRTNGNWEVNFRYLGARLYIGTFDTQEHAELANKIARGKLKTTGDVSKPTAKEIEESRKLARGAALDAVSKLIGLAPYVHVPKGCSRAASGRARLPKPINTTTIAEQNRKAGVDFRTVGVRQAKSGRWEVGVGYHGIRRYLGTFDTQDQAAVANEIARGKLKTRDGPLTKEEIKRNVKFACDAALDATISKLVDTMSPVVSEPNVTKGCSKASLGQMQSNTKRSPKSPMDFRTVGVRQTPSGKWEVGLGYQGLRRNIGTFDTQDQAALANQIGRKILRTTKGSKLTALETDLNMKLAREAAWDEVNKVEHFEDDAPPNEEDLLNVLLMSDAIEIKEAGNRPELMLSQKQSKKGFEAWHAYRKNKWRQQQQKERVEIEQVQVLPMGINLCYECKA